MALTVGDALKLPCMNDARLIAGANGLMKNIACVSVSECREFPLDLDIMGKYNLLFKEEEFFITSGYAIKDEQELLLDTVKLYSKYNSSGMCLSDRFFKVIDKAVIDYADAVSFPLIMMKRESAVYSDLIMGISQAILLNDGNAINETIVDEMRNLQTSLRKARTLAYKLNSSFQVNNHAACIFFDNPDKLKAISILKSIEHSNSIFAMLYRNYILIIFTSRSQITDEMRRKNLRYIKSVAGNYFPGCSMGVSNTYEDVARVRDTIEEAIIACEVAKINHSHVEEYDQIGTYKFLMHLREKNELSRFYSEMLKPVNELSSAKREELMNTLNLFIRCDGDIQLMSKKTFQHVNTIRYRVAKLRSIFGMERNELEFISAISLIYKIGQILDKDSDEEGR